jgi:hypothetical protein
LAQELEEQPGDSGNGSRMSTMDLRVKIPEVPSNATVDALFRRGVPHETAVVIAGRGTTFARLQQLDIADLVTLGLTSDVAGRIRDTQRPPIPKDVVARLMHECRRTCCVCREKGRSLVLHHTREWVKTHRHDEDCLVVICANCHGEAHTKRELGRNLTADELLAHRKLWASEVTRLDAAVLFDNSEETHPLGAPTWDYFNHRRLWRTAVDLGIDPIELPSYARLRDRASLDDSGAIDWYSLRAQSKKSQYIYQGDLRNADRTYIYFGEMLTRVVAKSNWIDLRSIWTQAQVKAVVKLGQIAVLTAGFRYRSAGTMMSSGPGQIREAYYKSSGIRLGFNFDAWETTSNSSRGNLRAIWTSTVICVIRSLTIEGDTLNVEATCLGIGTGFEHVRTETPAIAHRDWENQAASSEEGYS